MNGSITSSTMMSNAVSSAARRPAAPSWHTDDAVALVLELPARILRDVPIVFHQQDSHHHSRSNDEAAT